MEPDDITLYTTLNSVYEVDPPNKRIRRLSSTHELTEHQQTYADAETGWAPYSEISLVNNCLWIVWNGGRSTITSTIQSIAPLHTDRTH